MSLLMRCFSKYTHNQLLMEVFGILGLEMISLMGSCLHLFVNRRYKKTTPL